MTVLEIITSIIEKRKEEKVFPYCAMLKDTFEKSGLSKDDFRKECSRLVKEGKIEIKQTINSHSFYLKQ